MLLCHVANPPPLRRYEYPMLRCCERWASLGAKMSPEKSHLQSLKKQMVEGVGSGCYYYAL